MTHSVLARKWRPKNFSEMVGQQPVLQALINALDSQRLHHAYLFTGTRGVGKTTLARILAKCLNCETGITSTPCGSCSACREIDAGRFVDLIEVDAASRTAVEDMRELLSNVLYTPSAGRFKVYLIDEVHMLSRHSFNALLKTLEEPPAHVKFFLATTESEKIPVTVLSRCLQFHLKNISPEPIAAHLQHVLSAENIPYEDAALLALAEAANGSLRDALSLLDQAIAFGQSNIRASDVAIQLGSVARQQLYGLLDVFVTRDVQALMQQLQLIEDHTSDHLSVLKTLLQLLHDIAFLQKIPNYSVPDLQSLQTYTEKFSAEDLQLLYQIALLGQNDLPLAPNSRSGLEMVLLRMLLFLPKKMVITDVPKHPETIKKTVVETVGWTKSACPPSESKSWEALLPQLKLTGITSLAAQHCTLSSTEKDHWQLLIDAGQATLLNPQIETRIAEALSQVLQKPIRVSISVGQSTQTSPAAKTQQIITEKRNAAENSIQNDPKISMILEQFNGTITPNSIQTKPVKEEK